MTDAEALAVVQRHFESLFPKACTACGRRFDPLREYISTTKRVGQAMSYDAETGNWAPKEPMGSFALANCPCGSTLSLTTEGMPHDRRLELLTWLKATISRRGVSASTVLEELRSALRERVLEGGQAAAS